MNKTLAQSSKTKNIQRWKIFYLRLSPGVNYPADDSRVWVQWIAHVICSIIFGTVCALSMQGHFTTVFIWNFFFIAKFCFSFFLVCVCRCWISLLSRLFSDSYLSMFRWGSYRFIFRWIKEALDFYSSKVYQLKTPQNTNFRVLYISHRDQNKKKRRKGEGKKLSAHTYSQQQ